MPEREGGERGQGHPGPLAALPVLYPSKGMSEHFPHHPDAHEALLALGIDIDQSYRRWLLELAPTRAADNLAIPTDPEEKRCVVCGAPVRWRQTTCSDACRTRLWRIRASP